jgi:hypothetical protein
LRKKRNIEKAPTPGKLPYFLDRLEMFTQGTAANSFRHCPAKSDLLPGFQGVARSLAGFTLCERRIFFGQLKPYVHQAGLFDASLL